LARTWVVPEATFVGALSADSVETVACRDDSLRVQFSQRIGAFAMMGERRVMQEALFYGFSLERHVPDNHLLRKIDRFVDLSEVRAHLEPYYSETGRPSIDPELMMRMLIAAIALAFARNVGCATRSTSIWRIAGFVAWGSTATFPIIRPFPRTATAVSARAICCASCSRP
jgi:hypothetical protein